MNQPIVAGGGFATTRAERPPARAAFDQDEIARLEIGFVGCHHHIRCDSAPDVPATETSGPSANRASRGQEDGHDRRSDGSIRPA